MSTGIAMMQRGMHIAFTGTDGAGKSTQAGLLRKWLSDEGYYCYLAESKDEFATNVVRLVSHSKGGSPRSVFPNGVVDFAIAFDTLRHHTSYIVPVISQGGIVVVPRSVFCRIALADSFGVECVDLLEAVLHMTGTPDLTFWLDLPAEQAHARIERRGIDSEDMVMLARFRKSLDQLSKRNRWIRLDASQPIEWVQAAVLAHVRNSIAEGRLELRR